MTYIFVGGTRIEVREHRSLGWNRCTLTRDHLRRIETTLCAIPPYHASLPTRIEIRQRANAGGSANAMPDSPRFFVVLDFDCFISSWNTGPNGLIYTLLHEMGHVVDWTYRAFPKIHRNDPAGYEAICERTHRGRTQHDQEKFADAYADLHYPGARGARRWPGSIEAVRQCSIWKDMPVPRDPDVRAGLTPMI